MAKLKPKPSLLLHRSSKGTIRRVSAGRWDSSPAKSPIASICNAASIVGSREGAGIGIGFSPLTITTVSALLGGGVSLDLADSFGYRYSNTLMLKYFRLHRGRQPFRQHHRFDMLSRRQKNGEFSSCETS